MREPLAAELQIPTLSHLRLPVARLDGTESIGALFSFDLLIVHPHGDLDPGELIEQEASLVFSRGDVEERRLFGLVVSVRDRMDGGAGHASVAIRFVPRAYRLLLNETLDVVLDTSLPDILRKKLVDLGFAERSGAPGGQGIDEELPHDFDLRFQRDYPERELIVQYKESDLAFVSRLCEHIGVSYFFEHRHGRDVLVFTDFNGGFSSPDTPFPYMPRGERTGVYKMEETMQVVPSSYVVRDYNYRTPQLALTGTASLSVGSGSIIEYGAHVKTPEEATYIAQVRAEERLAGQRKLEGESDLPALFAGAAVQIEGHMRGDFHLLITEVTHHGAFAVDGMTLSGEGGYHNTFRAIPQKRAFRPARRTPKPRIHGVVTGIIDASEKGQYAKVDDQGRYLVRFVFDTHTPEEQQASRWVRMAQPHSGPGYGLHFPLRPGVEVILTFMDGDPDRPIIAATVPNPQTASPVTAKNAERNILRTGGGNEVNIDDTDGSQRIKLSSPFMSSVVQIGSPNAPDAGIVLSSMGNVTTGAALTANTFTTSNTMFGQWISTMTNHATNIAGKLTKPMVWAMRLGMIDAALSFVAGSVSGALGLVLSCQQTHVDATTKDAEDKAKDLATKTGERDKAEKAAVDALKATSFPSDANASQADKDAEAARTALIAASEAYDAALKKLEQDEADAASLEAEVDAAKADGQTTIYTQKSGELEEYTKKHDTDASKKGTLQKDREDLAAKKDALDTALATAKEKITSPKSLADEVGAYKDKNDAFQSARSDFLDAKSAKESAEKTQKDMKGVEVAQGYIDQIDSVRAIGTGIASDVITLYSLIMTATGRGIDGYAAGGSNLLIQEAIRQYSGGGIPKMTWVQSGASAAAILAMAGAPVPPGAPDTTVVPPHVPDTYSRISRLPWSGFTTLKQVGGSPLLNFASSLQWNESRQIVGSEEHTIVYGMDTLFLAGQKRASLTSRDEVVVTSNDMTVVHARHKTEVAGGEQVLVTSATEVDVLSRGTAKVHAVEKVGVTDKDRSVVDLTQADATVKVLDAADTEKASIKLESAGKATITVGNYLIVVDENQGISIGQKQGAALDTQKPHVKIEDAKITLCRKQGGEQIYIDAKTIEIQNAMDAGFEVDNQTTRMYGGNGTEIVSAPDGIDLLSGRVDITANQQNVRVQGQKILLG